MAVFSGRPQEINRFLGFVDTDDPSNLPVGVAALAMNCDFGLTQIVTRAGINLKVGNVAAGIQGLNQVPITGLLGLVYTPETAAESFFQLPILFDMAGSLQGEFAVGSGVTVNIPPATSSTTGGQPGMIATLEAFQRADPHYTGQIWVTFVADPHFAIGDTCAFSGITDPYFGPLLNGQQLQLAVVNAGVYLFTWLEHLTNYGPIPATGTVSDLNQLPSAAQPLVILPPNSHMMATQAYNKLWAAFSDLISPTGQDAVYNMKLNVLDPYGMKPFGWVWLPNTYVLTGEVCTPPIAGGNGHCYRCYQGGTTGPNPGPVFSTVQGDIFDDGTAKWQELTPVIANALASPILPGAYLTLQAGGAFPAGTTIYLIETFINSIGESAPSAPISVTTTVLDTAVQVMIPNAQAPTFPNWMNQLPSQYFPANVGIYIATSSTGQPPLSAYHRWGIEPLGSGPFIISGPATGPPPPVTNTARITPGQLPNPIIAPTAVRDALQIFVWSWAGKLPPGAEEPVPGAQPVTQQINFPADFAGSSGSCGTNPTHPATFGIDVNGSHGYRHLGVVRVTTSGVFTYDTGGQPVTIYPGEYLFIYTPAPQDSTLSDVSLTLLGNTTGLFPPGRDVYVAQTYVNVTGETMLGPATSVVDTNQNDGVLVTVPDPGNLTFTGIGIYEADVPTGSPAPAAASFALVGYYQPNDVLVITQTATGSPPPATNTTGPGGAIAPDTPDGGLNATQGYRYCGIQFINRNFTLSGFTDASVVKTIIDQAGWQISVFNLAPGPSNVVARGVSFTVADGTEDGPFFEIGIYDPGFPTNFVYPMTQLSAGQPMNATIIPDNSTESATFNFSDAYLIASTDVTDRLRVIWPYQAVDIYYSESNDRMIQTGVTGFNGHWISLAADPESYYADTGFIATQSADGERAICAREFRGTLYSLRERSGFTMTLLGVDTLGNASWDIQQRWDKIGPCGPRAVDTCGRFMIFVHRSGIYRYAQDMPEPDLVTKEIPYWWQFINWQAAQTIWCAIDEEKHVVRIGVPVGSSQVPNKEILLYYKDGWDRPFRFSPYSGHEVSMPAARRYAINDVAAFVGKRIERNIPVPVPSPFNQGDEGVTVLGSDFYTSQFLYGSSGPDGTVMAITPGVYHDGEGPNGPAVGIDWQYETVAAGMLLLFSKIEGANINARGHGAMSLWFLSGRDEVTDWAQRGSPEEKKIVKARDINLTQNSEVGISRLVSARWGERWRARFTNNKVPDAWAEVKYAALYSIPISTTRPESQG